MPALRFNEANILANYIEDHLLVRERSFENSLYFHFHCAGPQLFFFSFLSFLYRGEGGGGIPSYN